MQLDNNATPIRIELPFRPDSVNVYLFRQPEPVLIDAGYNSTACWDALVAGLAEQHLTPADLKHVVITHPHIDHYGLAARIARKGDAKVWIAHGAMHVMRLTNPQWGHRLAYYHDVLLPGMGLPDDMPPTSTAPLCIANPLPMNACLALAKGMSFSGAA